MRKYYEGDTGGRYLVGACGVGYFADVQNMAQAEDAARMWWGMTGDNGEVIIRERGKNGVVKIMRKEK